MLHYENLVTNVAILHDSDGTVFLKNYWELLRKTANRLRTGWEPLGTPENNYHHW